MSPIANTSGWPGSEQSGCTATRPARSQSAPVGVGEHLGQRRRLDSGRPDLGARRDALDLAVGALHLDPVAVDVRDDAAGVYLHPQALELRRRLRGEPIAEAGEHLLASVVQQHAGALGVDV